MKILKILLTGVAGFLGSNLLVKLLENGHSVIGLDDLSTGSIKNLARQIDNPNFIFIQTDIRTPVEFDVDAILNFACPASPVHYQTDPVRTIETNFIGVANLLHLAQRQNAIFIQSSTSEVYGDPHVSPQNEEYWGNVNPIGIRSCYDEGKRAAETLCFDYSRQYSVDARVIRIFNTYGPNMSPNDGRVVSNFIVQALENKPITIFGSGNQSRSFCYVDDLISAILRVLELDKTPNTPINLGNPMEFTMLELANLVIKKTGSQSKLVFLELPGDDPKQRCPDITRAKQILSWSPQVSLEDGLDLTIDYFRKLLAR